MPNTLTERVKQHPSFAVLVDTRRRFAEGGMSEEDYRARREVLSGRGEPLVRT